MKRDFIIDEEINLLNNNDLLNTQVYVETLQKTIINAPANKPFTIGLFGEWGSGKSSIVKTVRENLAAKKELKIQFAVFDAWKYSGDAFRRSFILSLAKQLEVTLDKKQHNLYVNYSEQIEELKISIPKYFWVIVAGICLIATSCYLFIPAVQKFLLQIIQISTLIFATSTIIIFLKKFIDKDFIGKFLSFLQAISTSKYEIEKPLLFSPEQFSDAFEEIIEKSTENNNKLIIIIDNIDRCEKLYACELLGTIKGFLECKEKVMFILPVDEAALKRHIKGTNNENDKESDEFLRKFFNVTLKIKPYHQEEIYDFAQKINAKYKLNFSDLTLDLVSKEYASNPRRIIQIFNNLSTELTCFNDEDFIAENEAIICKLLIIREEFPDYYYKLSMNPFLLNSGETCSNQNLDTFLSKTNVITEQTSIEVLNRILSNSKVFNNLPKEIQTYIESLKTDKILEFINKEEHKSIIVIDYLIKQLDIYSTRNLYSHSFINNLDVLVALNKVTAFDDSVHIRIESIIKPVLSTLLEKKTKLDTFIEYAYLLNQQNGRNYLITALVTAINQRVNSNGKIDVKWSNVFKLVLKQKNDIVVLEDLKEPFFNLYKNDSSILTEVSSSLLEALATKELKSHIISSITAISADDSYYRDITYLLGHTKNTNELENSLIKKINSLTDNLSYKTDEEISNLIISTNEALVHFESDFNSNSQDLKTLFDKLTGDRVILNPQYPHQRNYDPVVNYTTSLVNDKPAVERILLLCKHIYSASRSGIIIKPVLTSLLANPENRSLLNIQLMDLINTSGFTLHSLSDIIITDSTYTENCFAILKTIFLAKQKGDVYRLADNVLTSKLTEILNLILSNDSRKLALQIFLQDISNDDRIKKELINLISSQTKENILLLSSYLQSLAIDTILESDTIFNFEDNIDFLTVVANNGAPSHIQKLNRVISSKLQKESEFHNAATLILELNRINNRDAEKLLADLSTYKDMESHSEKTLELIDHIKKLQTSN